MIGITAGWMAATMLEAQATGIKRTLLIKKELVGIVGREVYLETAALAPGASAGRHFHEGHEISYLLEGTAGLEIEGEPTIALKPGDYIHVDPTKRQDAWNAGSGIAKALAVHLIERGKPLAVPAP